MNRILVFHLHETAGNNTRMAPSAYYMDADYEKVAVRIYAEGAPIRDAKIDIFDDGTSIFDNRAITWWHGTTRVRTVKSAETEAILSAGENKAEVTGDLSEAAIDKESWVHCNLVDAGGGKNFTVQLELKELSGNESL